MLGLHYKREETISPNEKRIIKTFSFRFDPWEMIKLTIREIRRIIINIVDKIFNRKLEKEITNKDNQFY
ncbi:MAG: hypothetical protein C4567_11300 [Deltaproteobacteria bacterium]|nr:MAG: hypothetical protein C4567_11300 [Deltaproteobacteria bacterium]